VNDTVVLGDVVGEGVEQKQGRQNRLMWLLGCCFIVCAFLIHCADEMHPALEVSNSQRG
jgi:hypothetical protein